MTYITSGKAAWYLGVSRVTVRRWVAEGLLEAVNPRDPLSHMRITMESVEAFLQDPRRREALARRRSQPGTA